MAWPPVCSGGGMEPWRQGPHVLRGAQRWVMVLVSSYSRIASREWMRMARCCSAFLDFILSRFPNCDSSYLFRNRNSPKETEMLGVVKQFRMKLNGRQIHLSKNRTRGSGGWDVWCEPLTIIKPERPKGLLHLARIPMCIVFRWLSVTFVVCWWGNDQGNSIGVVNPQRIWTPVIQSWRKHCRFHFDSLCTNVLKGKRSSNLSWRGEHPAT
jgi:hypothetical protein